MDENITPEQEALLRGLDYREYPSIQELFIAKLKTNTETSKETEINNTYNKQNAVEKLDEKICVKINVAEDVNAITHSNARQH